MNLNELRDKAYQCAVAHGWHEENRSDEHFLCLVISELMEAVEADRNGRQDDIRRFNEEMFYNLHTLRLYGENYDKTFCDVFELHIKDCVSDELADAFIRLLDLAGLRNLDLRDDLCNKTINEYFIRFFQGRTFAEIVFNICRVIVFSDTKEAIEKTLEYISQYCHLEGIDLFWHIEQKMKYNELRPYKHGDKAY